MRQIIFDIETDGLLDEVSRIWCVCLRILEDGIESPTYSYINDGVTDDLDDAIGLLEEADMLIGQNILGYDLPVIEKLYPDFSPKPGQKIRDTLVMSQMYFANEKDKDYERFRRGMIQGKDIGRHGLEAWGQRLGHYKGDYAKEMKAKGKDPWKEFEFETGVPYCEDDIEVNSRLWRKILGMEWSEESVILEHQISQLMVLQEAYGFWFDRENAQKFADHLSTTYNAMNAEAVEHFGNWWAPAKKYKASPREQFGEDNSRSIWAEVTVEKRDTRKVKIKEGAAAGATCHFSSDAPYCKIELKEFNPNSRPQIIDRLKTVYNWEPVDFTEAGTPEVNDEVLRGLSEHWPICETLAELFFYNKLLGMVANGDNAWLSHSARDGFIHGRCNPGGTRSGRASHSSPNVAQVPKVKVVSVKEKDGSFAPIVLVNGEPIADCFDKDGNVKKSVLLKGRKGDYGWECRSLFGAPIINGQQWWMMGCDLSGVELRCFGHHLAEFDGGAYLDIVLNGDVHTTNQTAAGLPSRDMAKTFIYATLYGAGDEKIGSIVCPPNTPIGQMKARGRELKAKFQEGVPAYRQLVKRIARDGKRGFLTGLDGRKLWIKSMHSALNLLLQSDGALLAKKWVILFHEYMADAGYALGWDGDYVQCAWVHDEIQVACRTVGIAKHAAELAVKAARDAGESFNYRAPIAAEAKIGRTWADTH